MAVDLPTLHDVDSAEVTAHQTQGLIASCPAATRRRVTWSTGQVRHDGG
jgi:hypothetical protein